MNSNITTINKLLKKEMKEQGIDTIEGIKLADFVNQNNSLFSFGLEVSFLADEGHEINTILLVELQSSKKGLSRYMNIITKYNSLDYFTQYTLDEAIEELEAIEADTEFVKNNLHKIKA